MSERSDLFHKDPLTLSDSDVDTIVAYYTERRGQFHLVDKKTGEVKVRKQRKARPKKPKVDPAQMDLEELIARAGGKS